jgi:uncharacterized membrane protein YidH (DUF202 family)
MWFAFYFTGVLASLVASVYYSVTARRRGLHPLESRMTLGKMNVSMGVLLLLFGINQFTFEPLTKVRIVVAAILVFVGAINLFFGARNYFRFKREWREAVKRDG